MKKLKVSFPSGFPPKIEVCAFCDAARTEDNAAVTKFLRKYGAAIINEEHFVRATGNLFEHRQDAPQQLGEHLLFVQHRDRDTQPHMCAS